MKIYYFSRGNLNKNYFLDCGKNYGDNRKNLGNKEIYNILKFLRKELDLKRKSVFYLVDNGKIDKKISSCLKSFFAGSKISLEKISLSDL